MREVWGSMCNLPLYREAGTSAGVRRLELTFENRAGISRLRPAAAKEGTGPAIGEQVQNLPAKDESLTGTCVGHAHGQKKMTST
jgi:hypothetical protein